MRIMIILCLINFLGCAQAGKDYQGEYESTALLLYLTKPTPEPRLRCEEAARSAGDCLWKALDKPPLPEVITQEFYTANILGNTPSGGTDSYQKHCETVLESVSLKDWSDSAKECLFRCQKEYWDTVIRIESCQSKTTPDLLQGISRSTSSCIAKCFRVTNN